MARTHERPARLPPISSPLSPHGSTTGTRSRARPAPHTARGRRIEELSTALCRRRPAGSLRGLNPAQGRSRRDLRGQGSCDARGVPRSSSLGRTLAPRPTVPTRESPEESRQRSGSAEEEEEKVPGVWRLLVARDRGPRVSGRLLSTTGLDVLAEGVSRKPVYVFSPLSVSVSSLFPLSSDCFFLSPMSHSTTSPRLVRTTRGRPIDPRLGARPKRLRNERRRGATGVGNK